VVKMIELINPRGWHHIRLVDREEEEPGDDEDSDDSDSGWVLSLVDLPNGYNYFGFNKYCYSIANSAQVCTERPLVPSRNLGQSSQWERYTHPVPQNTRTSITKQTALGWIWAQQA